MKELDGEFTVKQCLYADKKRSKLLNSMVCVVYKDKEKDNLRKEAIDYVLDADIEDILDKLRWTFVDIMEFVQKNSICAKRKHKNSSKEVRDLYRKHHTEVIKFFDSQVASEK